MKCEVCNAKGARKRGAGDAPILCDRCDERHTSRYRATNHIRSKIQWEERH